VIAARKAEEERKALFDARMEASAEVAATNVASGVRFAWDFEVTDINAVYRTAPEWVTMEIKRSAVLAWLKEMEESGLTGDEAATAVGVGIRAFKKPVVSSR